MYDDVNIRCKRVLVIFKYRITLPVLWGQWFLRLDLFVRFLGCTRRAVCMYVWMCNIHINNPAWWITLVPRVQAVCSQVVAYSSRFHPMAVSAHCCGGKASCFHPATQYVGEGSSQEGFSYSILYLIYVQNIYNWSGKLRLMIHHVHT